MTLLEGGVLLERAVVVSRLGKPGWAAMTNITKVLFRVENGAWLAVDGWKSADGGRRALLGIGLPFHGRGTGSRDTSGHQGKGCISLGLDPRRGQVPLDGGGVDVASGSEGREDAQRVGVLGPGPWGDEVEAAVDLRGMGPWAIEGLGVMVDGECVLGNLRVRDRVGRSVGNPGRRVGSGGRSVGVPGGRMGSGGRAIRRGTGGGERDGVTGCWKTVPEGRVGLSGVPMGRVAIRGHVVWLDEAAGGFGSVGGDVLWSEVLVLWDGSVKK